MAPQPAGLANEPAFADLRWLDEQRRSAESFGGPNPLNGGGDPLHLSVHWLAPLQPPPAAGTLATTGRSSGRAVLILDSMVGWYRALAEGGAQLPSLGERSWHIEVVVKPVGWLGTYRRSR